MSKHQHLPHIQEEPDPWHAHAPAEGLPQEEHGARANTAVLAVALIASVLFLVVVVAVIYIYFESFTTRLRLTRIENTVLAQPHRDYRERAAAAMGDYSVIDPAIAPGGVIVMPLDLASQRVIQRYAQAAPAGRPTEQNQPPSPGQPGGSVPPPPGQ